MSSATLKLKQASAVLEVQPKELQNLVQFGVLKPPRGEGTYLFDFNTLLTAKVAFCLKESLGTRANVLTKLIEAFRSSEVRLKAENPRYVVFTCRFSSTEEPIRLGIPFRSLEERIQQRMGQVDLFRDLPRGRKRIGWKQEFLDALSEAGQEIGEIPEEEILRTVRSSRIDRRMPEITVAAEN